jgi:AraC family transcriptional regulator of adaptative response/methylated-DNA-[protein]-cysteine methyltransferase
MQVLTFGFDSKIQSQTTYFDVANIHDMITIEQSSTDLPRNLNVREIPNTDDERWRAVLARDGNSDGAFVFAVRSTGIYCKPSCAARRPNKDQVLFFPGPDAAEVSGFRPCRRCRPHDFGPSAKIELIARVCKYVEANLDSKLTLSALSAQAGISPYHFQRTFKQVVGISPRQYVEAHRMSRMKRSLRNGQTVEKALNGAGFSSRSRVYEKVPNRLGVNPGTLRRGGVGLRIEYTIVDCPLGRLLLAATERGICAVCMGDSDAAVEAALDEDYPSADIQRNDEGMQEWASTLSDYFRGQRFDLNLPLDIRATAFQWRVWNEIKSIPYGNITTYSKIASALGEPNAARAVARACATNPVSLVIPCHRVVGKSGELRDYRWSAKRKHALLSLEQKTEH